MGYAAAKSRQERGTDDAVSRYTLAEIMYGTKEKYGAWYVCASTIYKKKCCNSFQYYGALKCIKIYLTAF